MMTLIRGIITKTTAAAGKLLRFDATGRTGETIADREVFQQYGLQSRPPEGSEALIVRQGNQIFIIASENREVRLSLAEGEVALSTDEGDVIHLKRQHKIEITAGPGGEVNIFATTVRLGGLSLDTAMGIVTGACSCSITGAPHAVTSQTAKATL
jgi:phage gp45-like